MNKPSASLPSFLPTSGARTALAAVCVAQTLAGVAHAQPEETVGEPTRLDRLTVQDQKADRLASPKFTEPLRDTPQTIAVIPKSVYVEQGATSLRDVLRNTPGITFQAGEGGNAPGDNLFIRGFGARNDVFIDGVRDPGVLARDTFNVESVEVAKGPTGAIAGRGPTGGAVNQVTKKPHLGDTREIIATAGNASYGRATLDVNEELARSPIKGTAVRVNAVWTDAGVPGRDVIKNTNWGVAPSLAFGLGTPTTLTLGYVHMSQDNILDHGLPGTLPERALAEGKTIQDLDWSNFYGLRSRDYEKVETDAATAIIDHTINSDVRLLNTTRYGRNRRDAVVTSPRAATPLNAATDPGYDPTVAQIRRTDAKYQERADEVIANQTNLTAKFDTGTVKHTVVTGIEVSREEQKSWARTDTYANGRPPVTDLYNPNPNDAYQPSIVRTGARTSAVADSGSVYAFDTIKFGSQWELSGGARWEVFDVAYKSVPATGAGTPVQRFQRSDDMVSWRAALLYKPAKNGSVYAGYGTSFNPSADGSQGLTLSATGNNSANLAPEKNDSAEIGTKWDLLGGRLATTAALFRTEKTNARTTDSLGNTVLAGEQRVDGVEFGVTGNITDDLTVFSGYAYMDGEVQSSGVPQQVDAALQYVPRQTFNLWATYRLPANFTIGAGAQFTDGYFYALPSATNPTPNEGLGTRYWLYNAMASYQVNRQLTLRLNVNNLANERYIDRGNGGHVIPGPGRSVLVSATLNF